MTTMQTYEVITMDWRRAAQIDATDVHTAAGAYATRLHPEARAVRVELPRLALMDMHGTGVRDEDRIIEGQPDRYDVIGPPHAGRIAQVRVRRAASEAK